VWGAPQSSNILLRKAACLQAAGFGGRVCVPSCSINSHINGSLRLKAPHSQSGASRSSSEHRKGQHMQFGSLLKAMLSCGGSRPRRMLRTQASATEHQQHGAWHSPGREENNRTFRFGNHPLLVRPSLGEEEPSSCQETGGGTLWANMHACCARCLKSGPPCGAELICQVGGCGLVARQVSVRLPGQQGTPSHIKPLQPGLADHEGALGQRLF
jgi:hypothetical protein